MACRCTELEADDYFLVADNPGSIRRSIRIVRVRLITAETLKAF